jgi:iron complex outermembrane recepter protein
MRLARALHLLPLLFALPALALEQGVEIADMSIEDLANIQITSVSKKPEKLSAASASVFVITADDIRRSGAATIPEVLRLAPNLQVAKVSTTGYAISARGMNGSNNSAPNKLLVLIDGRSVYAPLFSGVFWDAQDVMLEDVERIEVISGPGGTLWGVNAVNGVINITTRHANDTSGSLLSLHAGQLGSNTAFRHGGGSSGTAWRVYGKYLDQRHTELASGAAVNDARHQAQIGFRTDIQRGHDRFSLNGNAYRGGARQPRPGLISVEGFNVELGRVTTSGVNLTGQWTRGLAGGGQVALQAYVDHTRREVIPTFTEVLDIADLQFQHSLAQTGAHALVWGANLRTTWDDLTNSEVVAFLPASERTQRASIFGQDEVALSDQLRLTVGARVERNPYTGNEFLPTLRLAWTPSPAHTLWGALSRTVRAPSRLDADAFIPGRPPYILRGGPVVRSEVARVAELGYRGRPMDRLSYSVTAFFNDYDDLRTQETDPSGTFVTFDSKMRGRARGIEMWGTLQAASWWRLSAGLLALHQRFTLKPDSVDFPGPGAARKDPSHTLQLRSAFSLAADKDLDLVVRKVGALANPDVPGYTAIDARLGWRLRPGMELALIGQNLNGSHGEYGPVATRTELQRAVGVKLVWQM